MPRLRAGSILAALLLASPSFAAWPIWPTDNLPVSTAFRDQSYPQIVSDGKGGGIIVWYDNRDSVFNGFSYDHPNQIYMHHVLREGTVDSRWVPDGSRLAPTGMSQNTPEIAADGDTGAFVVWQDLRVADGDIYAEHITDAGAYAPGWPVSTGFAVTTNPSPQYAPVVAADGAGGALVAWVDSRAGVGASHFDIYAQHISAGNPPTLLPGDVVLCNAPGQQGGVRIIADDNVPAGAIAVWFDQRGTDLQIVAQHLAANGVVDPAWPVNGRILAPAAGSQSSPQLISDGAHGAIVVWADSRFGTTDVDVYAQRVLANGTIDPAWPVEGLPVGSAFGNQIEPQLVTDGAGGAIVTWQDGRSPGDDIYALRVLANGTIDPAWPAIGRIICGAVGQQYGPHLVSDGTGGAVITWYDYRNGVDADIYANHVLSDGSLLFSWPLDGAAVSTATGGQQIANIASNGDGGAIITWDDHRGASHDAYAQGIEQFGFLGFPAAALAAADLTGDQGGNAVIHWDPSYLDTRRDTSLVAYDLYRSPPVGPALATGATMTWQLVSTRAATHAPSYDGTAVAPLGVPTQFQVLARNSTGSLHWASSPVTVTTLDNMAPAPPTSFVRYAAAGNASLHWLPSHEPDFASYRLHRLASPTATPGPGDLIASPTDTGYVDPGGGGLYYKISAVDVHGNESIFALAFGGGTADVPGGLPAALAFDRPRPDPAREQATFGFAMPREARVILAIYDLSGRRRRTLAEGVLPAGAHELRWDLADASGRALGAGLYFARFECEGSVLTQRIAVIR